MFVVGFVLLAVAVAAVVVAIAQNPDALVNVHAFSHSWQVHAYWVLIAGMAAVIVAMIGLRAMRVGAGRARRIRKQRFALVRENERLSEIVDSTVQHTEPPDAADVGAVAPVSTGVMSAPMVPAPVMSAPVVAADQPRHQRHLLGRMGHVSP